MDRQEAIQTLSKVGKISVSYAEDLYDSFFPKPVVPQFVADWIEDVKKNGRMKDPYLSREGLSQNDNVRHVMNYIFTDPIDKLTDWVDNNTDTFVLAWLTGYTVEKEKRYTVKMEGIDKLFCFLPFQSGTNAWILDGYRNTEYVRTHHTRKELEEAGFGEVFNSPLFEVKEVE